MFSFLEYIVIVANIIFHLQAYYDLSEYSIIVEKFDTVRLTSKQSNFKVT